MTDETGTGVSDENIEVDLDHPWVAASLAMEPQPAPCGVNVDAVMLGPEGSQQRAAMLTTVTTSGVQTIFISPQVLAQHFQQIGEIFQQWEREDAKSPKLVVADKGMEAQARRMADEAMRMKGDN